MKQFRSYSLNKQTDRQTDRHTHTHTHTNTHTHTQMDRHVYRRTDRHRQTDMIEKITYWHSQMVISIIPNQKGTELCLKKLIA